MQMDTSLVVLFIQKHSVKLGLVCCGYVDTNHTPNANAAFQREPTTELAPTSIYQLPNYLRHLIKNIVVLTCEVSCKCS